MATIRKFQDKKKVIETSIEGFYIRALNIKESKELAKAHSNLSAEDMQDEQKAKELTMSLFALACDAKGESFEEFETYEAIEELSLEEFNMFANAIKEALVPGDASVKK